MPLINATSCVPTSCRFACKHALDDLGMLHQSFILQSPTNELHVAGGVLDLFRTVYNGQYRIPKWLVTAIEILTWRDIRNISHIFRISNFVSFSERNHTGWILFLYA